MRTLLFSAAAAASSLALATPASAQWYPQAQGQWYPQPQGQWYPQQQVYGYGYGAPQGYGYGVPQGYGYGVPSGYSYGAPYGNAYGYQNNHGHVRSLQVRINALQRQINRLDSHQVLSEREAHSLRRESRALEHRLVHAARFGLGQREYAGLRYGIERLERRISVEARDGNRYRRGDRNWQRAHQRWHNRNDRRGH